MARKMTDLVGFEPTHSWVKAMRLTAWRKVYVAPPILELGQTVIGIKEFQTSKWLICH